MIQLPILTFNTITSSDDRLLADKIRDDKYNTFTYNQALTMLNYLRDIDQPFEGTFSEFRYTFTNYEESELDILLRDYKCETLEELQTLDDMQGLLYFHTSDNSITIESIV